MKKVIIGCLVIDITALIALIVAFFLDIELRAYVILCVLVFFTLSYHLVAGYLFWLRRQIHEHEIPTPHGRLIDADALLKHSTVAWDDATESYDTESLIWVSCVKEAPTVVEAED